MPNFGGKNFLNAFIYNNVIYKHGCFTVLAIF